MNINITSKWEKYREPSQKVWDKKTQMKGGGLGTSGRAKGRSCYDNLSQKEKMKRQKKGAVCRVYE